MVQHSIWYPGLHLESDATGGGGEGRQTVVSNPGVWVKPNPCAYGKYVTSQKSERGKYPPPPKKNVAS